VAFASPSGGALLLVVVISTGVVISLGSFDSLFVVDSSEEVLFSLIDCVGAEDLKLSWLSLNE
jgi:hypothetical protein